MAKLNNLDNATLSVYIGTVAGYSLFEHPILGNDYPLLMALHGVTITTPFYEMPETWELLDHISYRETSGMSNEMHDALVMVR